MYGKRNGIFAIIWIVLGIALIILAAANVVPDFWNGTGAALAVVGIAQLVRYIKYSKDPKFKEKIDLMYSDERYAFIKNRSLAITAYVSIFGMCAASLVFLILGRKEVSSVLAFAICAQLIIYWVIFIIESRKN